MIEGNPSDRRAMAYGLFQTPSDDPRCFPSPQGRNSCTRKREDEQHDNETTPAMQGSPS
jgi:hypothetical protein